MPPIQRPCPECDVPLASDQRYCLGCGARVAPRLVEWRQVVAAAPAGAVAPSRSLPRPRTVAALILATLGAGTLAGAAAGPGAGAATRAPTIALVQPPAATATPAATAAPLDGSGLADEGAAAPAPKPHSRPAPEATGAPEPTRVAATEPAADPAATEPKPTPTPTPTATPTPDGPPAKHVVVVSLTGHDASAFVADSPATYLAHDLPAQGAFLRGYRATTTGSLANELSLLAGAAPTDATRADCPDPAAAGCRLEDGAASLPAALADGARAWKAYIQGLPSPCSTAAAPGYAPARNPFAFMGLQDCATSEASTDQLEDDFTDTDLAPSFAYVVPDTCHDGREQADCPGLEPTGLLRADAWLREWVPKLTASKAFADDGLLVVLFDGGNLPAPVDPVAEPPALGAVVVSRFARKGAVSDHEYDPLSLLRTIAGTFGVDPSGAAKKNSVAPLGADVLRSQDLPKSDTSP